MKQKIALVDIDQCLISNQDSEYNHELIKALREGGYKQIWLVTGRNSLDLFQHVLQNNTITGNNWKKQLLTQIQGGMETVFSGVFKGISTPHDHAGAIKTEDSSIGKGRDLNGYTQLEIELNNNQLVVGTDETMQRCQLDEEMVISLATRGDTEKKMQVSYLISHIKQFKTPEELQNLEVDFFDDKEENLKTVMETLKSNGIPTIRTFLTDVSVNEGKPNLKYLHPQHTLGLRSQPTQPQAPIDIQPSTRPATPIHHTSGTGHPQAVQPQPAAQHYAERVQTATRYINKLNLAAGLVAIASCTGIGYQQLINNQRSTNSKDTNHR